MASIPPIVYLVGFMGCGKTEVGPRVARALGREFEDTDCNVEAAEGRTVQRIFEDSGEPRFRMLERRVLDGLSRRSGLVVATGGGLFLDRIARGQMKRTGATVWLDTDLATVRRRVGSQSERPVWNRHDATHLRALFERRRASYALSDLRVDASAGAPDELADRITELLRVHFSLIFPGKK